MYTEGITKNTVVDGIERYRVTISEHFNLEKYKETDVYKAFSPPLEVLKDCSVSWKGKKFDVCALKEQWSQDTKKLEKYKAYYFQGSEGNTNGFDILLSIDLPTQTKTFSPMELKYSAQESTKKFALADVKSKLAIMDKYQMDYNFAIFIVLRKIALPRAYINKMKKEKEKKKKNKKETTNIEGKKEEDLLEIGKEGK